MKSSLQHQDQKRTTVAARRSRLNKPGVVATITAAEEGFELQLRCSNFDFDFELTWLLCNSAGAADIPSSPKQVAVTRLLTFLCSLVRISSSGLTSRTSRNTGFFLLCSCFTGFYKTPVSFEPGSGSSIHGSNFNELRSVLPSASASKDQFSTVKWYPPHREPEPSDCRFKVQAGRGKISRREELNPADRPS